MRTSMHIATRKPRIITSTPPATLPTFLDIDKTTMYTGNIQNFRFSGGEDFLVDAPLGQAPNVYPMMKGYDFSEDTSKNLGRPVGQRGVYRSSKTFSVQNSVATCRSYFDQTDQKYYIGALTSSFTPNKQWGQLYGLWMTRWKRGAYFGPGYKIADLLWPALTAGQNAPNSGKFVYDPWDFGEMDAPENHWQAYIHRATGNQGDHNLGNSASYQPDPNPWDPDVWHTKSLIWTPGQVQVYFDNTRVINHTGAGVPFEKMFVACQMETRLSPTAPPTDSFYEHNIDFISQFTYEPGLGTGNNSFVTSESLVTSTSQTTGT